MTHCAFLQPVWSRRSDPHLPLGRFPMQRHLMDQSLDDLSALDESACSICMKSDGTGTLRRDFEEEIAAMGRYVQQRSWLW